MWFVISTYVLYRRKKSPFLGFKVLSLLSVLALITDKFDYTQIGVNYFDVRI